MSRNIIILPTPGLTIGLGDKVINCPKCKAEAVITPYFKGVMENLQKKSETYELVCHSCTSSSNFAQPVTHKTLDEAITQAQRLYLEFYYRYLSSRKTKAIPKIKPNPHIFDSL